ncbi:MAG: hypothetical protein L3K26_05735 [Candidatus Hydrogenedentes bacterium]|nr:hypothetical protein [Candidatus Hydrogenedentota bacterium]
MVGIGSIGGGFSPYLVMPPTRAAETSGDGLAGALGKKSGLGEFSSVNPVRSEDSEGSSGIAGASEELSEDAKKEVVDLKRRDAEVRRHEQAHVAAAGRYANGGPQFEFTTGPDGRQYASGGEVSIDVSPASSPEATIQKAQVIRRAALAPAEPSGQDRSVANQASKLESEARRQLQGAQQEKAAGDEEDGGAVEATSASGAGGIQVSPPIARRDFSEYTPQRGGGSGNGGAAGVGRLDVSV